MAEENTAVAKVETKQSNLGSAKNTDELSLESAVKVLMLSGMVKDNETAGRVLAKLSLGRALGLPDLQSLSGIAITDKQQIILSAVLMNSLIRRSGRYYLVYKQRDIKGCAIEAFQKIEGIGWTSCGVPISFGPEDAKRAGLDQKATYKSFPVDLYAARALASVFRSYCADCCSAPAYLPEELDGAGYKTDLESGSVIPEAEVEVRGKATQTSPSSNPGQDLRNLIRDTGSDMDSLLGQYKVKQFEDLTPTQIDHMSRALRMKQNAPLNPK